MYDIESLVCAKSRAEAIRELESNPQALVIAGGTDVLIKIREGKLAGAQLVSIHDIPELHGIRQEADGRIVIGPLTTFDELENNSLIKTYLPLLGYAAGTAGGPQLRAQGTVGGNICNGVTSADTPPSLLCMNALLTLSSPQGDRFVPLRDFHAGPGKVHLNHAEILTAITIDPKDYLGFDGCYIKYAMRNAMDIATLSCAVWCKLTELKTKIADVRIAMGVAAPSPTRLESVEAALRDLPCEEAEERIGELVCASINPRTSWRASREFRMQIASEISSRALRSAIIKLGGKC